MGDFADVKVRRTGALGTGLKPPPRLSLSEWADEHFRLSSESSAQAGRWTCLPYQREILDSITDPSVTSISLMKSARIGYTLMVSAAVGYYIHQAPCSILLVQPTVEDVKGFSKETIAPMLRDVPVLAKIVFEDADEGPKGTSNTIQHKLYPGGVLSMVGANSGAGFRRVSRKVVIFDEVDAYPPSAGSDGDPIKLGTKRTEFFWDRKIIAGSTPLIAGASRIERLFEAGDQRRFYVPCPSCGHMDYLVFSQRESGGHWMSWPEGNPDEAHFICSGCDDAIDHRHKRSMIEAGEWRAAAPFTGHASFHIWAAYSYSPNSSWADLAKEFLSVKGKTEELKTYVNTVLGESWKEQGDAPDWERLYGRREPYEVGCVPAGVKFLTAGVDVQKDRFIYEVVGWGAGKESWSVDSGVLPVASTSDEAAWTALDELLARTYPGAGGLRFAVRMLAVDSGAFTQSVYAWARRYGGRVIATKGSSGATTLLGPPVAVDVTIKGKRIARGCKVWTVGVDIAKAELYGWLRLPTPEEGAPAPSGWCHFPEYGQDFFRQLTAEHVVTTVDRKGYQKREWQQIPGRENHWLDCRVYARAAATVLGLDRMRSAEPAPAPVYAPGTRIGPDGRAFEPSDDPKVRALEERLSTPAPAAKPRRPIPDSGFLGGGRGKGSWLSKKR